MSHKRHASQAQISSPFHPKGTQRNEHIEPVLYGSMTCSAVLDAQLEAPSFYADEHLIGWRAYGQFKASRLSLGVS